MPLFEDREFALYFAESPAVSRQLLGGDSQILVVLDIFSNFTFGVIGQKGWLCFIRIDTLEREVIAQLAAKPFNLVAASFESKDQVAQDLLNLGCNSLPQRPLRIFGSPPQLAFDFGGGDQRANCIGDSAAIGVNVEIQASLDGSSGHWMEYFHAKHPKQRH